MVFCDGEQRDVANCYFKILKSSRITAKEISQKSGITEANISKFRKGGDILLSSYQKLIDALPAELRKQYYLLILQGETPEKSDKLLGLEIADRLESSAYQLRQNRMRDN